MFIPVLIILKRIKRKMSNNTNENIYPRALDAVERDFGVQAQQNLAYSLLDSTVRLNTLEYDLQVLVTMLSKKVNDDIKMRLNDMNDLTLEEAMEYLERLYKIQISTTEVVRKIFQGKSLSNEDIITPQERAFLTLLTSEVNTEEKKDKLEAFLLSLRDGTSSLP
jgi:hypothetical protein